MKNVLNAMWNVAPRGKVQTAFSRFEKMPWGEMKSAFSESQKSWGQQMKDSLKTHYDDMWKDGE